MIKLLQTDVLLHASMRSDLAYINPLIMKKYWLQRNSSIPRLCVLKDVEQEPIFLNVGSGAKGYIWRQEKTLQVTFRGINGIDWSDIKANIDLRNHQICLGENFGNVQKGYWIYINSVFQDLMNQIDNEKCNINTINFSGHSMGSILAALAAFRLAVELKNIENSNITINCHTFGGPRFCDKTFSNNFMKYVPNSTHTIIKGDFVPDIVNGFDHCIKNVHYLEDPKIDTGHFERHACKKYVEILQTLSKQNKNKQNISESDQKKKIIT